MTLKNKAALSYLLPVLLSYVGMIAGLSAGARPEITALLSAALPASAILVASHLLQDSLSKGFKEFLVFYRVTNRLPGHRAFTEVCTGDPRIPSYYIQQTLELCGTDGLAQNAHWYGIYREVSTSPSVEHENLRYLAWRDATSTLLILALATPLCRPLGILTWQQVGWVSFGCLIFSLLTANAARNSAHALVKNAVAVAATGCAQQPME